MRRRERLYRWLERWTGIPLTEQGARTVAAQELTDAIGATVRSLIAALPVVEPDACEDRAMGTYAGAATLVLTDGTAVPGQTGLREVPAGAMRSWEGTFTSSDPAAGRLFDAIGKTLRIELPVGNTADVVVQSFGETAGRVTVPVVGSGPAPF